MNSLFRSKFPIFKKIRLVYRNTLFGLTILISIFSSSLFGSEKGTLVLLVSSENTIYSKGITGFNSKFRGQTKVVFVPEVLKMEQEGKIFFEEYEKENHPFMITFGVEATVLASKMLKNTPVLHSFVQSARFYYEEGKRKCGIDLKSPLSDYFGVLREIKPKAKSIYTFYSNDIGKYIAEESSYLDAYHRFYTKSIKVTSSNEFIGALEKHSASMDAFLMISDPIYNRNNFEFLSKFCREKGIVLMTIYPALVELGATFAILPDYISLGEETANFASRVLRGEIDCEMGPIENPKGQILHFNKEYANSSGIQLSESFERHIKENKLFTWGLELYYKNMFSSSKSAFDKILKTNPNHGPAKEYSMKLQYRLTQSETQKLTAIADEYAEQRNFSRARLYYSQVLALNPDLEDIRKKLNRTIEEESGDRKKEGDSAILKDNPFLAASKYLEAIKINPGNKEAQNALNTLRSNENGNLSSYLKKALGFYNQREYKESILWFNQILLLSPNHEVAKEYLRLSLIKKEAMERLENCLKEKKSGCELLN
ncbi:MAG: hypothetical protein KDK54_17335 [Leptospiraceae bacterium]|nr:hypothetical protein [Leptospiraceae bacterium]